MSFLTALYNNNNNNNNNDDDDGNNNNTLFIIILVPFPVMSNSALQCYKITNIVQKSIQKLHSIEMTKI